MRRSNLPARIDSPAATTMDPCVTPGRWLRRTVLSVHAAGRILHEAIVRAENLAWYVRLRGGSPNPVAGVSGFIVPVALVLAQIVWESGRAYTRVALARLSS